MVPLGLAISKETAVLLQEHHLLKVLLERMIFKRITAHSGVTEEEKHSEINQFVKAQGARYGGTLAGIARAQGKEELELRDQIIDSLLLKQCAREAYSAQAESHFLANKNKLDTITYKLIRTSSQSVAQEVYLRLLDGESDFESLAKKFSEGGEREKGGRIGPISLAQVHQVLAAKLRSSKPGVVIEPFNIERAWIVTVLERFSPARFDEHTMLQMCIELFKRDLSRGVNRAMRQMTGELPALGQ